MEEIWRDVKDYIGLYQVSNYGRVKSLERIVEDKNRWGKCMKRLKEKILRQTPDGYGYLQVCLCKDGVKEIKFVHKLVADAFLLNPNNYEQVHHINHIRSDNRLENLEWISEEEHRALHGTERAKVVYQYTRDKLLVNVWKSTMEAERTLEFNHGCICACCNNKYMRKGNNVYKGYIWSYSPLA